MKLADFSRKYLNDIIEIEKLSFERPWTQDMFIASASNKKVNFKVALENGAVAGYCLYWIIAGETEILNIAVCPLRRRRSYAKAMLADVITKSQKENSKAVFLDVRSDNEAAKKLYFSAGFEQIGVRKKYYKNKDALLLRKNLQ
ncbi:ribosomal protein S18-alanine N-acetyltransferase [Endomicrobium proavitum]|uniref:[Ribosomal protein bS18]-alanine N-acetyltransferase n=1 Tax=Endomicrobium proavitum TaxID=1408281 RepID=A0A0G3WL49_9BACT|nr:ribosomal protein S18-alanine N-acetyltransferase [Endomicrobium proavitum]AKL98587.1 Ribosomal-protein-alanine N-acetyltransferase [Endomicrobium proavitum]